MDQNIIADSAYWSTDSTEFNAYVTIDPLTQSDGINRIWVAWLRITRFPMSYRECEI